MLAGIKEIVKHLAQAERYDRCTSDEEKRGHSAATAHVECKSRSVRVRSRTAEAQMLL